MHASCGQQNQLNTRCPMVLPWSCLTSGHFLALSFQQFLAQFLVLEKDGVRNWNVFFDDSHIQVVSCCSIATVVIIVFTIIIFKATQKSVIFICWDKVSVHTKKYTCNLTAQKSASVYLIA